MYCTCNVTLRRACVTIVAVELLCYTFRVCVCCVKYACTILSSVFSPALQYFSTQSDKRHDFRKVTEFIMCVLNFSKTFVRNISHYRKN